MKKNIENYVMNIVNEYNIDKPYIYEDKIKISDDFSWTTTKTKSKSKTPEETLEEIDIEIIEKFLRRKN